MLFQVVQFAEQHFRVDYDPVADYGPVLGSEDAGWDQAHLKFLAIKVDGVACIVATVSAD